MRLIPICLRLECTDMSIEPGDPVIIQRWERWPCKPAVGETFWLWPGAREWDWGTFKIRKVVHQRVRRTFWERLRGKPSEVIMVLFRTNDKTMLEDALDSDPRWKRWHSAD